MHFFLCCCCCKSCINYKLCVISALLYSKSIMSSMSSLPFPAAQLCLDDYNDVSGALCRPLRARRWYWPMWWKKTPLISLLQTAAVCALTHAQSQACTHTHSHTHRLNMAVNKIVDAFSFGTKETGITLHVSALRIILFSFFLFFYLLWVWKKK